MRLLNIACFLSTLIAIHTSFASYAEDGKATFDIPTLEAINVFAHEQALPAVVNYYTSASQDDVIKFYEANYGNAVSSEMKRDRLMLKFLSEQFQIRVIISNQNNKRQVDVIVT